jgi:hypothetical protein
MKKTTFTILMLLTLVAPLVVSAQTQTREFCTSRDCAYIPLEPLPGQQIDPNKGADFPSYLRAAFTLFIVIGAMLAIATFVWGGIMYMISDIAGKKDFAKKQMTRSLWGILILVGSYLILATINPELIRTDRLEPSIQKLGGNAPASSNQNTNTQNKPSQADLDDCPPPKQLKHLPAGGFECK